MIKIISHKLEVFQKKCLRRIIRLYWHQTISNYELKNSNRNNHRASLEEEMEMGLGMCSACHQQQYHELFSDGPLKTRKDRKTKKTSRRTVEKEMKDWTPGAPGAASTCQTSMANSGRGLMYLLVTRRGLLL